MNTTEEREIRKRGKCDKVKDDLMRKTRKKEEKENEKIMRKK